MKHVAITGSWRHINDKIEKDVRSIVSRILQENNAIVTGGALGVDYIATDEVILQGAVRSLLIIYLPSALDVYCKHYLKRAKEGVITIAQANLLIDQLTLISKLNNKAIIEGSAKVISKKKYYARNSTIIENSDELVAFHINRSAGTQDTIDKANKKGIPVTIHAYRID